MVLGLLAVGVIVFQRAGELAATDLRATEIQTRKAYLDRLRADAAARMAEVQATLLRSDVNQGIKEKIKRGASLEGTVMNDPSVAWNDEEWLAVQNFLHYQVREIEELRRILHTLRLLGEEIRSLEIQWVRQVPDKPPAPAAASDTLLLLQTNINRFGPMFVILFVIALLMPLYRYNLRLAAYYYARGDTLLLLAEGVSSEKFMSIVSLLTPETYDFSKPPKLPLAALTDLVKELGIKDKR